MLLIKKIFFDAIRKGQKTTTLRFWRREMVKPNSVHNVRGLGRVKVETIEKVQMSDLSDEDAHKDGLDDLKALRKALDDIYPGDKREGRSLYRLTFTFIEE